MTGASGWVRRLAAAGLCATMFVLGACGGDAGPAIGNDAAVAPDDPVAGDGSGKPSGVPTEDDTAAGPPPFEPDPALGAGQRHLLGPDQWLAFDTREAATDAPALLLLHDLGASSLQWAPLVQQLPAAFGWLAIDLRGHGNASEPAAPLEPGQHVDDVLDLLAAQGPPRVTLVASGLGARVALELARRAPERVDRLVLIAADAGTSPTPDLQALRDELAADASQADTAFLGRWKDAAAIASGDLDRAAARTGTATWRQGLAALATPADSAGLSAIGQPVLRLLGLRDGLVGGAAGDLAAGLKADVGLTLEDAGRRVEAQSAGVVADLIVRFMSPRGTLHEAEERGLRTTIETNALTDGTVGRALVRDVTGEAFCDVRLVELEYQTVGAAGESTNASAAVGVPTGGHPECQGPRPLLLYAHGTSDDRGYDFFQSAEGFGGIALAMFAARGYIVVAPQYTGYGRSWLDYHPYLIADAQSADMVDALRAAETWLAGEGLARRSLFISGYSQGGYVAMATHRRIERELAGSITVDGSFPMSGPYALERTFTQILEGRPVQAAAPLVAFALEGYLRAQPSLAPLGRYYEPPYDTTADGLFPGTIDEQDAIARGLLPPFLLAGQGNPHLLRQDFVLDYLDTPGEPVREAFQRNSLLDWAPRAPMGLCGGGKDPLVFFDNSFAARDAFAARGVVVPLYDLNNSASLPGGRSNSMYLRFRSLFLFDSGLEAYHTALAPFCAHFARDFFQALRR